MASSIALAPARVRDWNVLAQRITADIIEFSTVSSEKVGYRPVTGFVHRDTLFP
jgi:hypothetical protein